MPTLGTQNIATSYPQLLKTFGTGGLPSAGAVEVITDGDNTSSALSVGIDAVQSTGSFTVSSNSRLLGPVTFGSTITASTGTSTIGTLFASGLATFGTSFTASTGTGTIGTLSASTATISTATIPLQLGAITFGSNITASTGTATIGTLSASTATISTATIPLQLGAITFGSNITASTGTATIGTESVNTSTIGTLAVSGRTTTGTLRLGSAGPSIIQSSYGSVAVTVATLGTMTAANSNSTGTFAMSGLVAGDIVIGQTNLTTSGGYPTASFSVVSNDVARYNLFNSTTTLSSITAGTISAISLRTTA